MLDIKCAGETLSINTHTHTYTREELGERINSWGSEEWGRTQILLNGQGGSLRKKEGETKGCHLDKEGKTN